MIEAGGVKIYKWLIYWFLDIFALTIIMAMTASDFDESEYIAISVYAVYSVMTKYLFDFTIKHTDND